MTLKENWPHIYEELLGIKDKVENHFKDVCDIEFTIEKGKLYILSIKIAKRTSIAKIKCAIDFFNEGKIDLNQALAIISPFDIENIINPEITNLSNLQLIGKGCPASNGAATGVIVFDENSAYKFLKNNISIMLVKYEVNPNDISLIIHAKGVLTFRGGMTSHAAIISRGFQKPCVSGCAELTIKGNYLECKNSILLKGGDFITIDGSNGNVYKGEADIAYPNWRNNIILVIISKMIEFAIRSHDISKSNIGHCWAIRDFLLHNISIKSNSTSKMPDLNINKYISFSEPKKETLNYYWKSIYTIANEDKDNYKYILQNIRNTLLRMLSNKIGTGNHPKYFRPLFNPMIAISSKNNESLRQLIGEEYFNINRYVSHLIDIYNIKIFLEIEVESENELWFLDNTNVKGESIVDKGNNITGFKLLVNEAVISYEDLPYFYNSFRKREYYWKWFQYNRTNYKEIVLFLKLAKNERSAYFRLSTYAHELGLLYNNKLTISGMSLVGLLKKKEYNE